MSLLLRLTILSCFICLVNGTRLNFDGDERNVGDIIQNLVNRLEEHEQRIRVLETKDEAQQQEINELKSVIRRKDSYLRRLKTWISTRKNDLKTLKGVIVNEERRKPAKDSVKDNKSESNLVGQQSASIKEIPRQVQLPKRLINSQQNVGIVSFYAYMSHYELANGPGHNLVFDHVVTNTGSSYNPLTGFFTAPEQGYYVFSWSVGCHSTSYVYTEIMKNSDSVGQIVTNSINDIGNQLSTGLVILELNANDDVHIQTHATQGAKGTILSTNFMRTSFSGWKL
ncbi:multimerin-1-like isoform X1 [Saccostrea cucullata]|uniref:multimerin-1-like isoform X1 n=1 Tax=Saccostrea cuccullata TaxID=36930 RepID=UPI002ED430AF